MQDIQIDSKKEVTQLRIGIAFGHHVRRRRSR